MAVSSLAAQRATEPVVVEARPVESARPAGPPGRAVQSADRGGTAGRHGREAGRSAERMAGAASSGTAVAVASTLAARSRRQPRGGLPPPATVAGGIAMALLEIEAGCRSVGQLERICSPALWSVLEQTVRRRGGPFAAGHALIRVHCQNHSAELADAGAVRGRRRSSSGSKPVAADGWSRFCRCSAMAGWRRVPVAGDAGVADGEQADGRPVAPGGGQRSVVATRDWPCPVSAALVSSRSPELSSAG
jgi:hypothetical protein